MLTIKSDQLGQLQVNLEAELENSLLDFAHLNFPAQSEEIGEQKLLSLVKRAITYAWVYDLATNLGATMMLWCMFEHGLTFDQLDWAIRILDDQEEIESIRCNELLEASAQAVFSEDSGELLTAEDVAGLE